MEIGGVSNISGSTSGETSSVIVVYPSPWFKTGKRVQMINMAKYPLFNQPSSNLLYVVILKGFLKLPKISHDVFSD